MMIQHLFYLVNTLIEHQSPNKSMDLLKKRK